MKVLTIILIVLATLVFVMGWFFFTAWLLFIIWNGLAGAFQFAPISFGTAICVNGALWFLSSLLTKGKS